MKNEIDIFREGNGAKGLRPPEKKKGLTKKKELCLQDHCGGMLKRT